MRDSEWAELFFSDDTAMYRDPVDPDPGDTVTVRLRTPKGYEGKIQLEFSDGCRIEMRFEETDGRFDYYACSFNCGKGETRYRFRAENDCAAVVIQHSKATLVTRDFVPEPEEDIRFYPGYHIPKWSEGALQYQIFVDRFFNGDPDNNVQNGEYRYLNGLSEHIDDWNKAPGLNDPRCFYGGNIAGIIEKLDYLQSLGVEVLYLNPIFVSPSSHKYDTQDYAHIDPHFGTIVQDGGKTLSKHAVSNRHAEKYRIRTADSRNLEASDALFARLCEQAHSRGMRILLDGVFNHCGSFNRWFDREGLYGFTGAWKKPDSAFTRYFSFEPGSNNEKYEGWWGYDTLPKLNYDASPELCEEILSIGEKWVKPPYSADGWRLDVAADLGHSADVNHAFWKRFRTRVKSAAPDALIIAEHYGDAASWLKGDEWDTVMNYDAFMDPVSAFFTGMEKHSDRRDDALYLNGAAFLNAIRRASLKLGTQALRCSMNELSNHDHSRFLTRTNGRIGRTQTMGPDAASQGISKALYRAAVVFQYTWIGCPTIYYADEAGQVGWTDPDNRRTYPWGNEDVNLINFHRKLAVLRNSVTVLRKGSLMLIKGEGPVIAYARFDRSQAAITVINAGSGEETVVIRIAPIGASDGDHFKTAVITNEQGYDFENQNSYTVLNNEITLNLLPKSAVILLKSNL